MVQIDPNGASGGPEQIRQQLMALAAALRAAAAAQGLPLTSLLVQYHSGVANAAPPNAPLTPFPGEATEGADAKQVGTLGSLHCSVSSLFNMVRVVETQGATYASFPPSNWKKAFAKGIVP